MKIRSISQLNNKDFNELIDEIEQFNDPVYIEISYKNNSLNFQLNEFIQWINDKLEALGRRIGQEYIHLSGDVNIGPLELSGNLTAPNITVNNNVKTQNISVTNNARVDSKVQTQSLIVNDSLSAPRLTATNNSATLKATELTCDNVAQLTAYAAQWR